MGLSSMLRLVPYLMRRSSRITVMAACAMAIDTPTIIAPVREARTMTHRINRRRLLAGATAATACTTAWLAAPALVRAQPQALKIAVLLPRSGYLAQAG